MLQLRNIQAGYGDIPVLHDISLDIPEQEIVTLIGANGAGKSTILMTISGIVPCRAGTIHYAGEEIQGWQPDRIVKMGISQVPEGRRIFPHMTVRENLEMGAFLRKDASGIREDVEELYSLFPILAERSNQDGGTLSGGEQQMLAISRALMARPRLLLLDEPSMGLSPLMIKQIFAMIIKINATKKTTIFLVEQHAHQALKIAHTGYVISNGRISASGPAADLLANPLVKKAYLGN